MKPFLYIAGFWGAALLGTWMYLNWDVPQPLGVLAPGEPSQVDTSPRTWTRGDAHFTALARFDIRARVLSTCHYFFDQLSGISPVDLALGWGRMSDSDVLAGIRINQGGRFYYWRSRSRKLPIPMDEVISHSANMHMIPADENVKQTLLDVRTGEIVTLSGFPRRGGPAQRVVLEIVSDPHGYRPGCMRGGLGRACRPRRRDAAARQALADTAHLRATLATCMCPSWDVEMN